MRGERWEVGGERWDGRGGRGSGRGPGGAVALGEVAPGAGGLVRAETPLQHTAAAHPAPSFPDHTPPSFPDHSRRGGSGRGRGRGVGE
eukprot:3881543-Rhodomonas_salina.1